ncbi:PilN domain-containing protein [Bradyrhizobium oligotrophicum]|uniref:PilN domain-containing protein n=1 Tax=Bradyrhizobium oligotrophicum TaxID=44255 RepID=UPI003EBE7444
MAALLNAMRTARPGELMQRAANWWCAEFLNLLPPLLAVILSAAGKPRIVLDRCEGTLRLRLTDPRSGLNACETSSLDAEPAVAALLTRHGLDVRDVELGLRLPEASVFSRDIVLPAEARGAIDAIVPQDLLRRTPFKAEDIYSDHAAGRTSDGRIAVRQWVTRRQHVQEAADQLRLPLAQFGFVVFGDMAPTIRLARKSAARQPYRIALAALCCSAVLLGGMLAGLTHVRQQAALDQLDTEIAVERRNAERVRATMEQLRERRTALARLRLQRREQPGLIDVWDEATRLLPAHSWLTELRLTEEASARRVSITLTGFSAAAPSLVGILDGSKLFVDAALTSPVAMDPIEGRERFSLQARLRTPDPAKEATQ